MNLISSILNRVMPDRFVMILLVTVVLASLLPVTGFALDVAKVASSAAIFCLFFLHGLRLPRDEVVQAAKNWRLQLAIFLFCFVAMPIAGLTAIFFTASLLPVGLVTGLLFLTILPSTVQSAISYSSMAGGNVAASVMAAALLNLAGIFVTPALFLLLASSAGGSVGGDVVLKIMLMLLLPFCLGQLSQRWLGAWALERKKMLGIMDKSVIALAVYVAFSAAVSDNIWDRVDGQPLLILTGVILLLLLFAFVGAWVLGAAIKLPRRDRISLLFSGAQKSIATGAPMAALMFPGPEAGMVILPVIIYHQLQLIISAPLASRLAASDEEQPALERT